MTESYRKIDTDGLSTNNQGNPRSVDAQSQKGSRPKRIIDTYGELRDRAAKENQDSLSQSGIIFSAADELLRSLGRLKTTGAFMLQSHIPHREHNSTQQPTETTRPAHPLSAQAALS